MKESRLKSGTSAAIFTGWEEASKVLIGPTPLTRSTQFFQYASLPMPFGATSPKPVTTSLRMIETPNENRWTSLLVTKVANQNAYTY
jgi:hypothetical protein